MSTQHHSPPAPLDGSGEDEMRPSDRDPTASEASEEDGDVSEHGSRVTPPVTEYQELDESGPDDDRSGEWIEETSYNATTGMYEPRRIPLRAAYQRALGTIAELQESQQSYEVGMWRKQWERADAFQGYTVSVFKTTLDNATRTYKLITTMSQLMFAVGIGLVVFAALYGTLADEKALALALAGLGITTFVAIFIVGPVDKAQSALSNLVQVEVGFMAAFEQIRMLSNYAWKPDGTLDTRKAEKASSLLHEHAKGLMALLQHYLEGEVEERRSDEQVNAAP
jgi:hypothetical protein